MNHRGVQNTGTSHEERSVGCIALTFSSISASERAQERSKEESKRAAAGKIVVSVAHVDEYCVRTRNTAFSADPRHLTLPRGETLFRQKLSSRLSFLFVSPLFSASFPLFYNANAIPRVSHINEERRKICKKEETWRKWRKTRSVPYSTGSSDVEREVFLLCETSFTSAGPGLLRTRRFLRPFSSRSLLRWGRALLSTNVDSLLPSRSRVANAPVRSLLLQPLLPDPLWSTDRTIKKDTRAASFQLATNAASSNLALRSTPILNFLARYSPPFLPVYPTFYPLFFLNRGEAKIHSFAVLSSFRVSLYIPFSQWRPLFSRRASTRFRSVARYCRNAVLPSFLDKMRLSFYSHSVPSDALFRLRCDSFWA